jgi:hypothetical protein
MAEEGEAAGMEDTNPQGSSKGHRGKGRSSGGKSHAEPATAAEDRAAEESPEGEPGGETEVPAEDSGPAEKVEKAPEKRGEPGERGSRREEPPPKSLSELLRFERRGPKRRR